MKISTSQSLPGLPKGKVANRGLCRAKRTDNPVLKKFDTAKETKNER